MSRKLKVLMVGAFPPTDSKVIGGIVTACRTLTNSLFSGKFELILIDSTQISNPPPSFPIRLLLAINRSLKFLIQFHTTNPDVVLLFSSAGSSFLEKGLMGRYVNLFGIPSLIFPRGSSFIDDFNRNFLSRWSSIFALGGATKVLCQGEQVQNFVAHRIGRKIEDTSIIRNWTASKELLNIGQGRTWSVSSMPTKIAFIGWLDREKGVLELLEVFARLAKSTNIVLEMVGEGNASNQAHDFVQRNGLNERVTFRGWLFGDDLVNIFCNADIFVLPSWSEGLPNAMIEAMATRLAVVVTSVGNIPSVIKDRENGLMVPPKNVIELERALNEVINDVALRNHLADQAFQFAKDNFGVDTAVDKLSNIIEVVTGHSTPPRRLLSLRLMVEPEHKGAKCAAS